MRERAPKVTPSRWSWHAPRTASKPRLERPTARQTLAVWPELEGELGELGSYFRGQLGAHERGAHRKLHWHSRKRFIERERPLGEPSFVVGGEPESRQATLEEGVHVAK